MIMTVEQLKENINRELELIGQDLENSWYFVDSMTEDQEEMLKNSDYAVLKAISIKAAKEKLDTLYNVIGGIKDLEEEKKTVERFLREYYLIIINLPDNMEELLND